jgi:DNA polymerase-3 subunit delta'
MSALVGHEAVLESLKRAVDEGRTAHAYLFTGREGVGKKLAAVHFACLLNCPGPDTDRSCRTCRRIFGEKHPDVVIERPEKNSIRIDRVRNLQGFFKYAPVEGRYRVVIIDDAHLINRPAQNALLKTLEEPPPGRILVLITAKPFGLLPTVRSRCRKVRFGPIPEDSLAGLLEREHHLSAEQATILASMSGGSAGRALRMASSNFMDLRERMLSVLADPSKHGFRGILALSAAISSDRATALDAIEIGTAWVRDLLRARFGHRARPVSRGDSLDRTAGSAQHYSSEALLAVCGELSRGAELIGAEINVNRNLVTDLMLVRIARILAGPALGLDSGTRMGREQQK